MSDFKRTNPQNSPMNPVFDPASFRIDTSVSQLMQTDPADFTKQAVNLANQLAQVRRQAAVSAAGGAGAAMQGVAGALANGSTLDGALARRLDPFGVPIAQSNPDDYRGGHFDYRKDVLPHQYTYASVYNTYEKFYYYYFDEALRNNLQNMLAMRRDGMIQELLRHRQLPTVSLDYHLVPDDPDDKAQQEVCKQITKVIDKTPRYQSLKLWLLEWIFFGKSGVKTTWHQKKINGADRWCIRNYAPIQGDKIVYKWDGTPGVLVWAGGGWTQRDDVKPYIDYTTIGPTFFLYNKDYRKQFIIGQFEASDFDYLFEPEKAAAVNGIGLRDRFYWMWNTYVELLSWQLDAMQRVGANGMLYAFFQANDPESRDDTLEALKMLVKENVSAFPLQPGQAQIANAIVQNIPPAPVGYDVMFQMMTYFSDTMRRGFLGQNLSSQSEPTGLGSGMSELHADMFENIVLYDAKCLEEVLDDQQLQPTIERNVWTYKGQKLRGDQLPFGVAYKLQVDRENVKEMIDAANVLHQMGVPLDMEDLRDKAGFSAPKNSSTALTMPGGVTGTATNQQAMTTNAGGDGTGGVNGAGGGAGNGAPRGPGRPMAPGGRRPQVGGQNRVAGGNGVAQPKATNGALARYARDYGAGNGTGNGNGFADSDTATHEGPSALGGSPTINAGVSVKLTFTPRIREGLSLFASRREWAIGDDPGAAILLTSTGDAGGCVLYTYDEATRDYVVYKEYGGDDEEQEAAVRDANALARWLAKAGSWSQFVTVGDLNEFDHRGFHTLHKDAYEVRAKVVGQPGPGVDCWSERLSVVDRSSEGEWGVTKGSVDPVCDETGERPTGYAANLDHGHGVMIALMLPPDVADALKPYADPDVAALDDFHVTLAYLGKLSELDASMLEDAETAVRMMADAYGPLSGVIKGSDRFFPNESNGGRAAMYAIVDIPGLGEFRSDLCEMLDVARIPYSKEHEFHPHVTIGYIEPNELAPTMIAKVTRAGKLDVDPAIPVEFPALALVVGGRVREWGFGDGMRVRPLEYAAMDE